MSRPQPFCLFAAILFAGALSACAFAAKPALSTIAERSGFQETGRYDEVIALCNGFAKVYPNAVRCSRFGTTPEGRPMQVMIVSQTGAFTPEAARKMNLPVMLVQGGIHAGEIDGKDAGFLALRQALDGEAAPGALKSRCCCSCRCSTSTAMSALAPGIDPTSAAQRKWAGAPRRRTSTPIAIM